MSDAARRLIEAVQHSLLGSLFVRLLWPNLFLASLVWRLVPDPEGERAVQALWLIPALIGLAFFIWFVGWLARPTYAQRRSALEELHSPPVNGFQPWERLPEGGLRPGRFMRAFVERLGALRSARSLGLLVLQMLCLALIMIVTLVPGDALAIVDPRLANTETRIIIALSAAAICAVLDIQSWAAIQRTRLAPA